MKRVLLLTVALLALAAPAMAGGINLAWGPGCWWDNPSNAKTFACDVNTGNASFTASFASTKDFPDWAGLSGIVDLQTDLATLPAWWELYNSGSCRSTALSTSANFLAAPGGCVDPWQNLGQGGIAAYQTAAYPPPPPLNAPPPNRARLKVAYVVVDPVLVAAGIEYYAFTATVTYVKTVGTDACAGCAAGMVLVLNEVAPMGTHTRAERISNPIANVCLSWNGATTPCGAVPAHNSTWGQVKSLYR